MVQSKYLHKVSATESSIRIAHPNLNDQDAILAWVNHFSKTQHDLNDFGHIRRHFMKNFPRIMFADCDEEGR